MRGRLSRTDAWSSSGITSSCNNSGARKHIHTELAMQNRLCPSVACSITREELPDVDDAVSITRHEWFLVDDADLGA
eukprot:3251408-Prymnesium_polylepis.2